jgi:hypothetical protein
MRLLTLSLQMFCVGLFTGTAIDYFVRGDTGYSIVYVASALFMVAAAWMEARVIKRDFRAEAHE